MPTVAGLRQQVRFLKQRATPVQPARQWSMILMNDEEVSQELRAKMGPHDTLFIRRVHADFLPERPEWGQIMSCWRAGAHGIKKPYFIRQYNVDVSKV